MKQMLLPTIVIVALASLALYGCSSSTNNAEQTSSPPADTSDGHGDHGDHSGHDDHSDHGNHGGHSQTDMEKMKAELAKLSPEDAASAEKQHFCPVSGEMLGTMGAPKKIDVNGQHVWICCDGCKDKLLANPDEYLAKLQRE